MHVTHYYLLGFFSGEATPQPPAPPAVALSYDDDGADFDAQVESSNAAAVQFMMLAALAIQELH